MWNNFRIRTKILLGILPLVIVVLAATIGYISWGARNLAKREAFDKAEVVAGNYASLMASDLNEAMDVARSLGAILIGMKEDGTPNRKIALAEMRQLLDAYPRFLGVWTVWESNAFDGKDAEYVDKPGHDKSGRFVSYWNRASGSDTLEPCVDYDNPGDAGQYYFKPLKNGEETVMEPFSYVVAGRNVLLVSLCVPIVENGKAVGVAGVDIAVDAIQEIVAKVRPFEKGSLTVISNGGMIAGHPNPDVLGKNVRDISKGQAERILDAIRKGEVLSLVDFSPAFGGDAYKVHVPMAIGRTKTPWSVVVVAPMSVILAEANRMTVLSIVAAAVGLLIVALVIFLLAAGISGPIVAVSEKIRRFAAGDCTLSFEARGKDEVGEMAAALNEMAEFLRSSIASILTKSSETISVAENLVSISEKTVHAMEGVRNSITEVAALSESNSAALEETNAGVEEVSSGASSSAQSATEGAESSNRMTEKSERAGTQVAGVVRDIRKVGEQARVTTGTIREVTNSVGTITQFVTTIKNIADQTNLLALNAAIEAARAGEAGRGFSVVAEEVRKLAEESNGAAKEVDAIIGTLQQKTQDALRLMGDVDKIVELTVKQSESTGRELSEALVEIARVNDVMQNIAAASEEQAAASGEMAQAVDSATKSTVQIVETLVSIRAATDETTDASANVANEAQTLSSHAREIRELLSRFKVDGGRSALLPRSTR